MQVLIAILNSKEIPREVGRRIGVDNFLDLVKDCVLNTEVGFEVRDEVKRASSIVL